MPMSSPGCRESHADDARGAGNAPVDLFPVECEVRFDLPGRRVKTLRNTAKPLVLSFTFKAASNNNSACYYVFCPLVSRCTLLLETYRMRSCCNNPNASRPAAAYVQARCLRRLAGNTIEREEHLSTAPKQKKLKGRRSISMRACVSYAARAFSFTAAGVLFLKIETGCSRQAGVRLSVSARATYLPRW